MSPRLARQQLLIIPQELSKIVQRADDVLEVNINRELGEVDIRLRLRQLTLCLRL